jgi:hypothetical protein
VEQKVVVRSEAAEPKAQMAVIKPEKPSVDRKVVVHSEAAEPKSQKAVVKLQEDPLSEAAEPKAQNVVVKLQEEQKPSHALSDAAEPKAQMPIVKVQEDHTPNAKLQHEQKSQDVIIEGDFYIDLVAMHVTLSNECMRYYSDFNAKETGENPQGYLMLSEVKRFEAVPKNLAVKFEASGGRSPPLLTYTSTKQFEAWLRKWEALLRNTLGVDFVVAPIISTEAERPARSRSKMSTTRRSIAKEKEHGEEFKAVPKGMEDRFGVTDIRSQANAGASVAERSPVDSSQGNQQVTVPKVRRKVSKRIQKEFGQNGRPPEKRQIMRF